MKNEVVYAKEIAKEINRVLQLEHNKENYIKFQEALKDLKPKSCTVKIGWGAGEGIGFTIGFEKGGTAKPFDLFVANIEDKAEIFGFLCGLYPEVLEFNTMHTVDDNEIRIVTFKLKRDEQ